MMSACTLEEACDNGEILCAVCNDDQCQTYSGTIYRESRHDGGNLKCRKYLCLNGVPEAITPDEPDNDICENGFDEKTNNCNTECEDNTYRCHPDNEPGCKIQACKKGIWSVTETEPCVYGYDEAENKCLECTDGAVQCIPNQTESDGHTEDISENTCALETCQSGKWEKTGNRCIDGFNQEDLVCNESNCVYGTPLKIDSICGGTNQDCLPECQINSNEACSVYTCKIDKTNPWLHNVVTSTCRFGMDHNAECHHPCNISDRISDNVKLYDPESEKIYECNENDGWYETTCGNFDFHTENEERLNDNELNSFKSFLNTELSNNQVGQNLYYGYCGTCSKDSSPSYLTETENHEYISHECKNGEIVVHKVTELPTGYNSCSDNNGLEVFVDNLSNRYHCGGCNHVCGNSETCIEAQCRSIYECTEGEFIRIDIGSRWVKAYCVSKPETLMAIRDAINAGAVYPNDDSDELHNHDNAYILANSIDFNTTNLEWESIGNIDHPFTGVFFGNQNTIKLGKITPSQYMGLFGVIKNAMILSLNIQSMRSHDITLPDDKDDVNFGLLAGVATDSNIQNINIFSDSNGSGLNVKMTRNTYCKNDLCRTDQQPTHLNVGGMIGHAESRHRNASIQNCSVKDIDFNIDYELYDETNCCETEVPRQSPSQLQIGGMVGIANTISADQNISLEISNSDLENITLSDGENHTTDSLVKHIAISFGGGIGKTNNVTVNHFDLRNIHASQYSFIYNRIFGSITGNALNSLFNDGHIHDIHVRMDNASANRTGGAIGYARSSKINHIDICTNDSDHCTLKAINVVGGLIGYSLSCTLTDNHVKFEMVGNDDINRDYTQSFYGGLVAHTSTTQVSNSFAEIEGLYGGSRVGGLIGSGIDLNVNDSRATVHKIDGNAEMGGLIGFLESNAKIINSHARYHQIVAGNIVLSEEYLDDYKKRLLEKYGNTNNYDEIHYPYCIKYDSSIDQTFPFCARTGGLIGYLRNAIVTVERCDVVGDSIEVRGSSASMIGGIAKASRLFMNESWSAVKTIVTDAPYSLYGTIESETVISIAIDKVFELVNFKDIYDNNKNYYTWIVEYEQYLAGGDYWKTEWYDPNTCTLEVNSGRSNYKCSGRNYDCYHPSLNSIIGSLWCESWGGFYFCDSNGSNCKKTPRSKYPCLAPQKDPIQIEDLNACHAYANNDFFQLCTSTDFKSGDCIYKYTCVAEMDDPSCMTRPCPTIHSIVSCTEVLDTNWQYPNGVPTCNVSQIADFFGIDSAYCTSAPEDSICVMLNSLQGDIPLPANVMDEIVNHADPYVVKPDFCQL